MIFINAFLRHPVEIELFNNDQSVIENKAVFVKSVIDGHIEGAYYTSDFENSDYDAWFDLYFKLKNNQLYVLDFYNKLETGLQIKLPLVVAEPFDIKSGPKHLKAGKIFYVKETTNMVGPYFLQHNTDPDYLKNLLDNNEMYVVPSSVRITLNAPELVK